MVWPTTWDSLVYKPALGCRFQAESESWEALLIKHRSKAEELER